MLVVPVSETTVRGAVEVSLTDESADGDVTSPDEVFSTVPVSRTVEEVSPATISEEGVVVSPRGVVSSNEDVPPEEGEVVVVVEGDEIETDVEEVPDD